MKILSSIKLVSALLLLCCIFLPIAKCSKVVEEGYEGKAPTFNMYVYGSEYNEESIIPILLWSLPFILAVIAIRFSGSISLSLLQLVAGFGSVYAGFWIFIWAKNLLWPSYVASISMVVYCVSAALTTYILIRQRYLTKSSKATPKSGAL